MSFVLSLLKCLVNPLAIHSGPGYLWSFIFPIHFKSGEIFKTFSKNYQFRSSFKALLNLFLPAWNLPNKKSGTKAVTLCIDFKTCSHLSLMASGLPYSGPTINNLFYFFLPGKVPISFINFFKPSGDSPTFLTGCETTFFLS